MSARPRIFVFGASLGGHRARRFLGRSMEVLGFLDNDSKKHGTSIAGRRVYGPEVLDQQQWDRIVIASMYDEEIFRQLMELGVPITKIDVLDRAVLLGDDDPPWGCWIVLLMIFVCIIVSAMAVWKF